MTGVQTCALPICKIILTQPVSFEQVTKLLATGKTDLLDGFVSNRTKRKFKAHLMWDESEGKVGFEFAARADKAPAAKKAVAKTATRAVAIPATRPAAKTVAKTVAKKAARKTTARKTVPRKTAA